jgi:hypothetical protein
MANYIVPGIYVEDKKSSTPILSVVSQDSVGFSGVFKRGFVGKLVQVSSPTVFDKTFGDEKNQPSNGHDYNMGYYLSTITNNFYVSRAIHYSETDGTPSSDSDQTSAFGYNREALQPIFKVATGTDVALLDDDTRFEEIGGKKMLFIGNDLLDEMDTWDTSLSYVVGDTVVFSNKLYVCILNANSSISDPTVATTYWKEIILSGSNQNVTEWTTYKPYIFGDMVTDSGSKYICKVNNSNHTTWTALDWIQIETIPSVTQEWDNTVDYERGDFVNDGDTKYYQCILSHVNSDTIKPLTNVTYWVEVVSPDAVHPEWLAYNDNQKDDIVIFDNKYYLCKVTVSSDIDTGNTTNWTEFELPNVTGDNILGWNYRGAYAPGSTYNKNDVVIYTNITANYYICRVNGTGGAWNSSNWKQIYPITMIKTGVESDESYYIFTGSESDFGNSAVTLNKIQEYDQPSILFSQNYRVGKVVKQTTLTGISYTILLQEGQEISSDMASCSLSINGTVINSGAWTYLSENTIQFELVNANAIKISKGDKLLLSGVIEGSDVEKLPSILYYTKDTDSEISDRDFTSSVDGWGSCKGIYNVYDENFDCNIALPNGGVSFFAKTPGEWGNNLSVVMIGKEYWESEYNEFGYLYPAKELLSHELVVIISEFDSIVETFVVSIDENFENAEGSKYYIDTVINSQSNYVSCKYFPLSFEELEGSEIDNVFIGSATTVGNWKITRTTTGAIHSEDESFKYKVVATGNFTFPLVSGNIACELYINDVDSTNLISGATFSHNGYTYTVSGTGVTDNYLEWNSYHPTDASGIRVKFVLEGGVSSNAVTTEDVITAYKLFNTAEVDTILPIGNRSYTKSEYQQLAQGVVREVLAKKINSFGLLNVPYKIFENSNVSNRTDKIAEWSNGGGFFVSSNNDKYEVYDTWFNCIVKNKKVVLPKSVLMVANHLTTFAEIGRHQPVAGTTYGIIGGFDSIIWYPKTEDEIRKLILAQVNPTMFIIGKGFINWEQKTFLKKAVVESEANVILAKIMIQSDVQKLLVDYPFNLLNATTKFNIESLIKQYLNTHIRKGTIESYTVTSIEETNIFTLRVKISILFPRALKFVVLEFETLTPKTA